MVHAPTVNSEDYDLDIPLDIEVEMVFEEDSPSAKPKHGTSIQAGWGAATALLAPKNNGDYPNDFKFSEAVQLVRFLDDAPFSVYQQHWVDRTEGKRSFVCLGDECPLCDIAGDKPRGKFAFNVLVLSDEEMTVQILTAPPTFARQLRAANDDERRGPLSKHFWAVSRQGSGPQTTYTLERIRAAELAEEWDLDPEKVTAVAESSEKYGAEVINVTPRAELLTIARAFVS